MRNIFDKSERTADGGTLNISYSILSIGFLILVGVILVVLGLDHWLKWDIALRDYISICTFGCVTIGLIYNAAALQYNFQLNKQKFEKENSENKSKKIKITYEAISDWYKKDMAMNCQVARKFMQPYKGKLSKPKCLKEFKKKLDHDENIALRQSFISVLNYFEHLSLLIADDVIDEEVLKKAFKTLFTSYYVNLKEYIEDEQRGNAGGNSKNYINFVDISKKWLHI